MRGRESRGCEFCGARGVRFPVARSRRAVRALADLALGGHPPFFGRNALCEVRMHGAADGACFFQSRAPAAVAKAIHSYARDLRAGHAPAAALSRRDAAFAPGFVRCPNIRPLPSQLAARHMRTALLCAGPSRQGTRQHARQQRHTLSLSLVCVAASCRGSSRSWPIRGSSIDAERAADRFKSRARPHTALNSPPLHRSNIAIQTTLTMAFKLLSFLLLAALVASVNARSLFQAAADCPLPAGANPDFTRVAEGCGECM